MIWADRNLEHKKGDVLPFNCTQGIRAETVAVHLRGKDIGF